MILTRQILFLSFLFWASSAISSQLGNGLLGYALYGGSSLPGYARITSTSRSDNGDLDVYFAPAPDTGGYPVSGYQYSVDGGTWLNIPEGQGMFTVPDSLLQGTNPTVLIRTVSAAGVSRINEPDSISLWKTNISPVPTTPVWLLMLMAVLLVGIVKFRRQI